MSAFEWIWFAVVVAGLIAIAADGIRELTKSSN
jgi:hypothetical protein